MKKIFLRFEKRLLISLLCSIIVVFGINNSFYNGQLCLKAHAASVGAAYGVGSAGTYLAEIILSILSAAGLYGAYSSSDELQDVVDSYVEYATSSEAWIDQADDVMQVYCQVTGATYDYTWSDLSDYSVKQDVLDAIAKTQTQQAENMELYEMYREGILTSEEYLWLDNYVFTPSEMLISDVCNWVKALADGEVECSVGTDVLTWDEVQESNFGFDGYEIVDSKYVYRGRVCSGSIDSISNSPVYSTYYQFDISHSYSLRKVFVLDSISSNSNLNSYNLYDITQDGSLSLCNSIYAELYNYSDNSLIVGSNNYTMSFKNGLETFVIPNKCYKFDSNIPIFNSLTDAQNALISNDFSNVINKMVVDKGLSQVIDNNDLPTIGKDDVRNILDNTFDCGTVGGIYGGLSGTLGGLWDLAPDIPDIYTKVIDGILDGTYEDADVSTYEDAWEKAISDALDDVRDDPIADTDNPAVAKDKADSLSDAFDDALDENYPFEEPTEDPENPESNDENGFPKETGGLLSLFNALIYLILILIMLLIIFISCLAFIVMIFRIPAQTGFLPLEMVQGLDYLKTLQIPGFGMSVYGFFMALVYIILLFTVVGLLRKNIDKIRIPRKRGK